MAGSFKGANSGKGREGAFWRLPFAEQFLIWAAVPALLRTPMAAAFRRCCRKACAPQAFPKRRSARCPALGSLPACRSGPEFHALRCPCIGRDERMLIRATAAGQKGDGAEIRKELETLLPSEMVRAAEPLIREIGHALLCAGLRFEALLCRARTPAFRASVSLSRSVH